MVTLMDSEATPIASLPSTPKHARAQSRLFFCPPRLKSNNPIGSPEERAPFVSKQCAATDGGDLAACDESVTGGEFADRHAAVIPAFQECILEMAGCRAFQRLSR